MRILILADIHGNWSALSAIQEEYDECFVLGDLVDYGTDPGPCVDWVRKHATHAVRGNHDHAVVQGVTARGGVGLRNLVAATRPFQKKQLSGTQLKYLSRLPLMDSFRLGDHTFLLVHATPRDPLDEYLGAYPERWEDVLQAVDADVICVGHTHRSFDLQAGSKRVINPGSVGQPRDGDPRACYAIWEDGHVEFRRVEYDIGATLSQMTSKGVEPWAVEMMRNLLNSGGTAASSSSLPQN